MTITTPDARPFQFELAGFDLYRNIHKGIRSELYAVTEEAGRLDPSDRDDRAALAAHLGSVVTLLASHAEHEDASINPSLEVHLPDVAARIVADHEVLDARIKVVGEFAEAAVQLETGQRTEFQKLYLELASFTSAYLAHQDFEERVVMPALEQAIGFDGVFAINQAIVSSIPPDQLVKTLAIMLPAMNVDDRTELLGGMKAGAPPEVFQGVWSLAGSVLTPGDRAAVARRLEIA